jgi:hypothetical protein
VVAQHPDGNGGRGDQAGDPGVVGDTHHRFSLQGGGLGGGEFRWRLTGK